MSTRNIPIEHPLILICNDQIAPDLFYVGQPILIDSDILDGTQIVWPAIITAVNCKLHTLTVHYYVQQDGSANPIYKRVNGAEENQGIGMAAVLLHDFTFTKLNCIS